MLFVRCLVLAILLLLEILNLGRVANFFFYEFVCICIYFLYICHVIFNLLILIFMRNTFILSHFLDFLNEQGLFASYLKEAMSYGERSPFLLQTLFFRLKPDVWLSGAFSWDLDSLNDWRSVNDRWLVRLNTLKSENSFSN